MSKVRRVVGEEIARRLNGFTLAAVPEQPNLFNYVMRTLETLWMGVSASYSLNDLVTQPVRD
ncbi:hypothetical protein [Metapseudomonas boanensis]|uniref:Uncharacterized protein n=1 Tax=Metapseudomonas boanensis TaxID=2822138 RepID=A0ABS5XHL2_9GAMM|nr:hypothetical protein [Pseudomonas boanensis]MBT8766641.1 hypothetical protein [Pseudomonas boanensis]